VHDRLHGSLVVVTGPLHRARYAVAICGEPPPLHPSGTLNPAKFFMLFSEKLHCVPGSKYDSSEPYAANAQHAEELP
jgi:hypothetical protein